MSVLGLLVCVPWHGMGDTWDRYCEKPSANSTEKTGAIFQNGQVGVCMRVHLFSCLHACLCMCVLVCLRAFVCVRVFPECVS